MEQEIMLEISKLLEKTGLEEVMPPDRALSDNRQITEAALINLKSLNARYEKNEAVNQIQWLMGQYNIQIDELIERINA